LTAVKKYQDKKTRKGKAKKIKKTLDVTMSNFETCTKPETEQIETIRTMVIDH